MEILFLFYQRLISYSFLWLFHHHQMVHFHKAIHMLKFQYTKDQLKHHNFFFIKSMEEHNQMYHNMSDVMFILKLTIQSHKFLLPLQKLKEYFKVLDLYEQ